MRLIEQTLSHNQMDNLRSLGLDTSDASLVKLFFYTDDGSIVDSEGGYEDESHTGIDDTYVDFFDSEAGNYDHSYREEYAVYTLQDVLNRLPKEIIKNGKRYKLMIIYPNDGEFEISYNCGSRCINAIFYDNLLIAAYKMLCWLLEEGFLKEETK